MEKYSIEYFIDKFGKFPEQNWGCNLGEGCVLAQCGVKIKVGRIGYVHTEESKALILLFGGKSNEDARAVYSVNDDHSQKGGTPKQRVMDKLCSLLLQKTSDPEPCDKDAEEAVKQVKEFIENIEFEEINTKQDEKMDA